MAWPASNTAVFSGLRSQYTLIPLDGNGVRVTGPDGADMLTNLEKLTFNDQTVDWTSGFKSSTFELAAFGPGAGGWSSNDTYPRKLADVDGGGMADIVAFSSAGVYEVARHRRRALCHAHVRACRLRRGGRRLEQREHLPAQAGRRKRRRQSRHRRLQLGRRLRVAGHRRRALCHAHVRACRLRRGGR